MKDKSKNIPKAIVMLGLVSLLTDAASEMIYPLVPVFVADLVNDQNRGTAYGLFSFSVGLGALPASILFGFLYSYFDKLFPGYGGTVAFGFGGTVALVSMILLAVKVKEPPRGSF
jgi:MFS family permease